MPRLVVLNGPPGIGKSTVALRYVDDHPLALSLEQDAVRGLLGAWRTRETESGTSARELCGYPHEYERLVRCLADRDVIEIASIEGDPEGTYRAVLAHL